MPTDIRNWMDKHELNICELDEREKDDLMESCDEATFETDFEDYIEENEEYLTDDFQDEYDEFVRDFIRDIILGSSDGEDIPKFCKWLKEYKEDEMRDRFGEERHPDNYYPLWCFAWQFPSDHSAEELNAKRVPGLVFFDYHGTTMVSLTTVGMDMSPSIYFAYLMYSELTLQRKPILEKIMSCGIDYFKYVIGTSNMLELIQKLGKSIIDKYDTEGKKRYKEFDETLKRLTDLRDKGEMDQVSTGLLGLMALSKTQRPMEGDNE